MDPLINILTRTSNRPNNFKRTLASIRSQSYTKVNHVVCTDDSKSEAYLRSSGISDYVMIDRRQLILEEMYPDPGTWPYSPHNVYFNIMHEQVSSGWVLYLDDDDVFLNEGSLASIADFIKRHDEDTILFWRMQYSDGKMLPPTVSRNHPPKLYRIGGSCFTFHSKYLHFAGWDSWKCSDFRVIDRLYKVIPKMAYLDYPMIFVRSQGLGTRKDE